MKFSIIIPVYNGAKYLKNAIDSVLRQDQSGGFNIEVILVENGSTDDSMRLCDDYAARFHMITAVHREKIGAYAARRLGMELSSGEWLLFLDADDELKDDALLSLHGYISTFSCIQDAPDIIFYDYERVASKEVVTRTFPFEPERIYEGTEKKNFYDAMCQGDLLNPLWNKCVKRQLAAASLAEDPTIFLNHGEDLLQTAQLIDRAEKIAYLHQTIYIYRCDNQGLSGAYHREYLSNQKYAWDGLMDYAGGWTDTPDEYEEIISRRKTLTTTIALKSLVMSDLGRSDVLRKLKEMFEDPFYREYAKGQLPEWASEEDVFFHEFQTSDNPYKKLAGYMTKYRIKAFVKGRIKK